MLELTLGKIVLLGVCEAEAVPQALVDSVSVPLEAGEKLMLGQGEAEKVPEGEDEVEKLLSWPPPPLEVVMLGLEEKVRLAVTVRVKGCVVPRAEMVSVTEEEGEVTTVRLDKREELGEGE